MRSSEKPRKKDFKSSKISEERSASKLALGFALLVMGIILILGRNSVNSVLSTSFENEPVSIEGLSDKEFDESKLPKRIIIPSLLIDLDVKESQVIGGYWEVFENSAAWGEGSGVPGEIGNQVIFAHAREGLFQPLRSIKAGVTIYVLTESDWYKYEVKEIKEVLPNQLEVIAATDDETLTLYTCSGFADSKRLIVISKRI